MLQLAIPHPSAKFLLQDIAYLHLQILNLVTHDFTSTGIDWLLRLKATTLFYCIRRLVLWTTGWFETSKIKWVYAKTTLVLLLGSEMLWTTSADITPSAAHDELCINLPSGIFLSASFSSFQACISGSGYRPHSWLLRRRLVPSRGTVLICVFPSPFSFPNSSMTYIETKQKTKERIPVFRVPLYRDDCLHRQ